MLPPIDMTRHLCRLASPALTTKVTRSLGGLHLALFLSSLAVSTTSFAQSSVTLYGIISTVVAYTSNQGGKSNVSMISGAVQNNRWGLRIREDLGAGNMAVATLENGFSSTTGTLGQGGRMFGRQAYVGLSNATYGTVTVGRQYDMLWDFLNELEPQSYGPGLGANIGSNDNIEGNFRYSNSIKYSSPKFGAVRAEALYAFSNKAGGFSQNRAFSAGVGYDDGKYRFSVAYLEIDRPGLANTAGAVSDDYQGAPFQLFHTSPLNSTIGVQRQRVTAAGGQYKFGAFSVAGIISDVRYKYLDQTSLHLDNYDLVARYFFTPSFLIDAAYLYTNGRYGGLSANPHWNQTQIGLDYYLSKRTDVSLAANYIRSSGPGAPAVIFLVSPSSSQNQVVVYAGIRHLF
jgi:general bacterial porin, GBP family